MRVILMHNPSAGEEDHAAEELIDEIERHGHHVIDHVSGPKALARALRRRVDVVAVAGGDGTVGKAARVLAGTRTPITVLPLGTANNIAGTLGLGGTPGELIAGWAGGVVQPFDSAVVHSSEAPARFLEGLGFGAFPRAMRKAAEAAELEDREATLQRDLRLLRCAIAKAPLKSFTLEADGEDLSGDYLLVEILNIPTLGPNVALAPRAHPGDGHLDLVLAGEPERALLLAYVDRRASGQDAALALPSRQVREVVVKKGMRRFHRDGDLCAHARSKYVVRVEPGTVQVLVPAASR